MCWQVGVCTGSADTHTGTHPRVRRGTYTHMHVHALNLSGVTELAQQPLSRAGAARPRLPAHTQAHPRSHTASPAVALSTSHLGTWEKGAPRQLKVLTGGPRAHAPFGSWQPCSGNVGHGSTHTCAEPSCTGSWTLESDRCPSLGLVEWGCASTGLALQSACGPHGLRGAEGTQAPM